MKLIDISVPLDVNLPAYPGNTPFSLEPIKPIARGDETLCFPLRVVGSDSVPARVVLRSS
jgi:kynurenine formamidase